MEVKSQDLNPALLPYWHLPYWVDPAPPWNQLVNELGLDKATISQTVQVRLNLATKVIEAQKMVLDAQLKALAGMQDIIRSAAAK